MTHSRVFRILVAVSLISCSNPSRPHLGSITPGLKDWLRQQCEPEEVVESRSLGHIRLTVDMDDAVFARYRARPLVSIGCADGEMQHLIYADDDKSLIDVVVLPRTEEDAKGWLFELGEAGADGSLLAKARSRIRAASDEIEPFEGDGIRVGVFRATRRITGRPPLAWAISAEVTR